MFFHTHKMNEKTQTMFSPLPDLEFLITWSHDLIKVAPAPTQKSLASFCSIIFQTLLTKQLACMLDKIKLSLHICRASKQIILSNRSYFSAFKLVLLTLYSSYFLKTSVWMHVRYTVFLLLASEIPYLFCRKLAGMTPIC